MRSPAGVSRSMISVVERGESSPTAVVLEKLAAGLGVTMASLFEAATGAASAANGPVARLKDQPQWKDLATEATSRRYVDYQLRVAKVEKAYGKSAVSQSSVPRIEIRTGGLSGPEIAEFLREHLRSLAEVSPPESRHALNLDELRKPDITFWSVWEGREVVGCGALKELDPQQGEIKSMRTAAAHLRKGVGTAVLEQIIAEAKRRGYRRLSLETGAMPYFTPAHRLYRKFGFTNCPPFADYVEDPNSVFMTKSLER